MAHPMTITFKSALVDAALLAAVPAAAQAQQVKPVCTDSSRACLLKTVNLYLDGLTHHNASAIPFAPNVRCTEQGGVPVTTEAGFRHEIDISGQILGARNVRLMVDTDLGSVGAFYVLDVAGDKGQPSYTVRRGERFKVVGGLITEVEVINYVDPKISGLAPPIWPD